MNHALAAARTALVEIDPVASGDAIVAAVKAAVEAVAAEALRARLLPEPTVVGTVVEATDIKGGKFWFRLRGKADGATTWWPMLLLALAPVTWEQICAIGTVSVMRPEPIVAPAARL